MICQVNNNWYFWDAMGGRDDCNHEYEENDMIAESEYTGTYLCIHCGAILEFDVEDIEDILDC